MLTIDILAHNVKGDTGGRCLNRIQFLAAAERFRRSSAPTCSFLRTSWRFANSSPCRFFVNQLIFNLILVARKALVIYWHKPLTRYAPPLAAQARAPLYYMGLYYMDYTIWGYINFLHEFHYTIFKKNFDEGVGVHFFGPHFSQKMTQKYDQKSNFFSSSPLFWVGILV